MILPNTDPIGSYFPHKNDSEFVKFNFVQFVRLTSLTYIVHCISVKTKKVHPGNSGNTIADSQTQIGSQVLILEVKKSIWFPGKFCRFILKTLDRKFDLRIPDKVKNLLFFHFGRYLF